ncbi:MAG: hypothetical protein ACRCY3_15285 [Sphingorhabdus sp.]
MGKGNGRSRVRDAALACVFALAASSCGGDDTSAPPPVTVAPTPPPAPPPPPPTSNSTLISAAIALPPMPKELTELLTQRGGSGSSTFASGTPYNDLEYTIFDTDYNEGETNGFDTFMPVDPSQPSPGANQIKIMNGVTNPDLDEAYAGQKGDRFILGTAEINTPFFAKGSDGVDNDYAIITNFDYKNGFVQLRGTASDYGLVLCRTTDGCDTGGYYLFHTASGSPDLIAFIFQCDDIALPLNGNVPRNARGLCNSSEVLSLQDSKQFSFAKPIASAPTATTGASQFGTVGKEIAGGVASDASGNTYVLGASDGSLDGGPRTDNEVFVAKIAPNGSQVWATEVSLSNGSLLFDGVADSQYLYVAGRTLSALPGFTNKGRWDGIILKLRLSDGVVVASDQWGNEGLDGYGNITLDDAGNLFVSGAGSPVGASGTDDQHLVAKHRTSDLGNVWRQIVAPVSSGQIFVSEAWGGLTYVPGATPGGGRLVAGGWLMAGGGANGFLEIWESLNATSPQRVASTLIASGNNQADWVLDNVVDAAGNIYAVGYTTGALGGAHSGNGDAFIVKFDRNLQNPIYRQVGTAQSDMFRKLEVGLDGSLYAQGYTYGDYNGTNADSSRLTGDVFVLKFDPALGVTRSFQFGTANEDRGFMSLQGSTLHIGGMTEAALGGANRGSFDGFVMRLNLSLVPF